MLRVALPPLVTTYAIFVAMVVLARSRPVGRPHGGAGRPVPVGRVLGTAVGGYLAFLVLVLVFHVWIAGESDALSSAVWGGAFLSIIAIGGAVVWSVIGGRLMHRRRGR